MKAPTPLISRPAGSGSARLLVALALLLSMAGAAFLSMPHPLASQESVTIRGKLINGTAGAENPGAIPVLMLVSAPDGTLTGTGQTIAEPDGSFAFEDIAVVQGGSYAVSVDYDGVFYGQSLFHDRLRDELQITVYEPTEDAGIVHVDRQVIVISEFDVPRRVATATEFVRFTNPTDRTLRPNLETARPGMFSFMRFALPPNAADVTVQSNLRGGEIISVGTGFALTAAVPPGEHSVDFAYTFPYEGAGLEYHNSLPQGAEIFQVLIRQQWNDVEISGLEPRPAVGIGDEVYHAWEARDIPPGPGVPLNFRGLPQPGIISRIGTTVSGGPFWITALPSALGAVLLALLLLGLFRRYQPAGGIAAGREPDASATGPADSTERELLVAGLADLDNRYEQGGLDEDDYSSQRSALVARALGAGTEPPT